jgi:hypothetical protein
MPMENFRPKKDLRGLRSLQLRSILGTLTEKKEKMNVEKVFHKNQHS